MVDLPRHFVEIQHHLNKMHKPLNEIPLQEVQVAPILNSLERILIVGAEPPLNRQGPKFGEAQKYSQHRDLEFVYPTDREILRQLYDQMAEEEEDPQ